MFQKGFVPLVIVLILAGITFLIGGAYYLVRQYSIFPKSDLDYFIKDEENLKNRIRTEKPSPTPADETANWKTYTNDQMQISFKYPSSFLIVTEDNKSDMYDIFFARSQAEAQEVNNCLKELECYSYPFAVRFKVLSKPTGKNLKDIIWTDSHVDSSNFISVRVDGQNALQDKLVGISGSIVYHVYVNRNETVFYLQIDMDKDLEKNVELLLSTFKFLK